MTKESKLIEGKDFYLNRDGLMILTAEYLLKRGRCCQSGCTHCPYPGAKKSADIPSELLHSEDLSIYESDLEDEDK